MKSRMEKYEDNESRSYTKREQRNQQLYRNVSKAELEDFDVYNNVSVLGKNSKNIDIEQVRDMLDRKYHVEPKRKFVNDDKIYDVPEINLDETREYDLTQVLDKVKSNKEVNYEEERLKKVNNTQYDILKNLDVFSEEVDDSQTKEEKELVNLINTINAKEEIERELKDYKEKGEDIDPLDILSDLRGDDDSTRVMGALELDAEKKLLSKEKTDDSEEKDDEDDSAKHTITELKDLSKNKNEKEKEKKENEIEKSYTTTQFDMAEFDDFSDLKEGSAFVRVLVKIVAFIIVMIFIAGCIIFAKKFF